MATRQLRRRPGFALAVVGMLALATAANVAVFAVVNAVLLRALPYAAPERLLWIMSVRPDNSIAPFTLPEFMDYRIRTKTLSGLTAYAFWSGSLAGNEITEGLQGIRISANAFDVLGLKPAAGRLLRKSDDRPDAPKVVVLSYRVWQRRFGGVATAVGASVRLSGESYTIVGVLSPYFVLPVRDVDVVLPLVSETDANRYVRNSPNSLRFFGRLNPRLQRRGSASGIDSDLPFTPATVSHRVREKGRRADSRSTRSPDRGLPSINASLDGSSLSRAGNSLG